MQISLILLPVLAYILFTLFFYRSTNVKRVWDGFVKGHLTVFLFIAISTELLSLLDKITLPAVLLIWLVFLLAGFVALYKHGKALNLVLPASRGIAPITVILGGAIAFILPHTSIKAKLPNASCQVCNHAPSAS